MSRGSAIREPLRSLREAPATVPALGALALFVAWASSEAGYPVTHWAPGGLIVMGLLVVAQLAVPLRLADIPRPVRIAIACLAGYTIFSFLSILWAAVPGDAWEGADRTLLYLLVFVLFAVWPQQGRSAAALLVAWALAMIGLAVFVLVHLDGASGAALATLIPGGRLAYPSGYVNANAAEWLMALWPAVLLARSERIAWPVRGLLAGGAVLLAGVALLSQSRGSLYATAVMLVLVFALLPGRVRTLLALVPVAIGIGLDTPAVLHVTRRLEEGNESAAATTQLHSAIAGVLLAAVLVGLVFAAAAAAEAQRAGDIPSRIRLRVHRAIGTVAIVALILGVVGGLVAVGDPIAKVKHGWYTFKAGYAADSSSSDRLVSGLGSSRYDFYRVALDEFVAHPLLGIGADNFAQQYLRKRRSDETPHYPHSVELRTLSQTGLVGTLLALVGLGAALLAAGRAIRSRDRLAGVVAAAALGGFGYWVVHGSIDWFWEFAGLGAPAFAMLGLTCSLSGRRVPSLRPARAGRPAPASTADRSPPNSSPQPLPAPGGLEGLARSGSAGSPWATNPPASGAVPERTSTGSPQSSGPGQRAGSPPGKAPGLRPARLGVLVLALVVSLAAAASFAAPWLSQMQVERAARIWRGAPVEAYSKLDSAARLNPLSDEPYLVAGGIALRFGDLERAHREFSRALARTPGDAYATLELGAIDSQAGDRKAALRMLERAAYLNPRERLVRRSLALVRRDRRIDVDGLNQQILLEASRLE